MQPMYDQEPARQAPPRADLHLANRVHPQSRSNAPCVRHKRRSYAWTGLMRGKARPPGQKAICNSPVPMLLGASSIACNSAMAMLSVRQIGARHARQEFRLARIAGAGRGDQDVVQQEL